MDNCEGVKPKEKKEDIFDEILNQKNITKEQIEAYRKRWANAE